MAGEELDDLQGLRERIAGVDRELFALLAKRMELAERVGRIKAERSLPISVREIEEGVLARARGAAATCGISEEVMQAIFRAIVQGSVERQHRTGIAMRSRGASRVLIVGSAGGMGRWFERLFALVGSTTDGVDPASGSGARFAAIDDVRELDVYESVLLATPLATTPDVLARVVERRPRGTVVEVSSIKAPIAPVLARARELGVEVLALHPMFGPRKPCSGPLVFALATHADAKREERRARELLAHPYADVVAMPLEHHDRMMGWLLGLAHLSGMLFASALARSGLDPEELERCASTTYARQKATATSILGEDPALYLEIQRSNPHREEVYAAMGDALEELAELVRRGDRAGFARCLERARRAVGS